MFQVGDIGKVHYYSRKATRNTLTPYIRRNLVGGHRLDGEQRWLNEHDE